MELLIIRHGQSEGDILKKLEGRANFKLTDLGIEQAEKMAEWVKENYPPDYILSSPLKRASKTAQILESKVDIGIKYFDELLEFNNGLLGGLSFDEAKQKYPKYQSMRPHDKFYQQESLIEFRARAETILSKIIYEFPSDKRIAIVSHGRMINMLYKSFLNLPFNTPVNLFTGDTGIHLWKIDEKDIEKREIVFQNSLQHLI